MKDLEQHHRRAFILATIMVVGVVTFVWADAVADWMSRVMPFGWQVRSKGTHIPAFDEAFSTVLRWNVGVAALASTAALCVWKARDRVQILVSSLRGVPWEVLLTFSTMGLYAWLAWPHLVTKSNSRIHWVDIFFEPWVDSYWYTLIKLPHIAFYDYPWLWQSLNAGLNISLVMFLVRRATGRRDLSIGAGIAFLVSGQILLFASTAEDVHLAFTAILAFMVSYQLRRPIAIGVSLWVLMLARPPFLVAVPAYILVEYLSTQGTWWRRFALTRSARVAIVVFAALFVSWHAWLNMRGTGWLLADGRILNIGYASVEPQEVDGFRIFPFSGSYIAHFLWLLPLPVLLFLLSSWPSMNRVPPPRKRLVYWSLLFGLLTMLVSEASPQMYFNVRYVTYGFLPILLTPFLVFPLRFEGSPVRRPLVAGVLVALSVGSIAFPHQEFAVRETMLREPLLDLYPHRFRLQQVASDRPVYVDVDQTNQRYLVSYALKASINHQHVVSEDTDEVGPGLLVTTSDAYEESWDVVLRTEAVGVYILERPVDAEILTRD